MVPVLFCFYGTTQHVMNFLGNWGGSTLSLNSNFRFFPSAFEPTSFQEEFCCRNQSASVCVCGACVSCAPHAPCVDTSGLSQVGVSEIPAFPHQALGASCRSLSGPLSGCRTPSPAAHSLTFSHCGHLKDERGSGTGKARAVPLKSSLAAYLLGGQR